MIRLAFSTVACPDWTLDRAIRAAGEWGYQGLELRTFGYGSREFACDPALTDAGKAREMLAEAGVHAACIATGVAFDEPIRPPVIGRVKDNEASVRRAKTGIELAEALGAHYVRVFAFEIGREKRARAFTRIVERLSQVADAARHTGVKVVLENGGSFPAASDLVEFVDRVGSPNLGAAYSLPVAVQAGEDPVAGAAALGESLWMVKVKDYRKDQTPCILGDGALPCREFVGSLASRRFGGWIVAEWDRAWVPGLAAPERVLPTVARRLTEWSDAAWPVSGGRTMLASV